MQIPFSLTIVAALLACTSAVAQTPDLSARKLTMIVGFAPGGGVIRRGDARPCTRIASIT